jgi:pectate lyase
VAGAVIDGATVDCGGKTLGTSCDGGSESQSPVISLKNGATIKNLVLKAGAAADGVHCISGSCTLSNVKWAGVCEDAATLEAGAGSGGKLTISGGSGTGAEDKMFQHNAIGGTITVTGFAGGTMGKLVRSCGDCTGNGGPRYVNISNTTVGSAPSGVVGINSNYGDKATIRTLTVPSGTKVCVTYKGVVKGNGSSTKIGEEWGTTACNVSKSDVTYK